jgi:hypothetical protein
VTGIPALPGERIERSILLIRGEKVMLDDELASLYGVDTKALTRAVRRNLDRVQEARVFPLPRPRVGCRVAGAWSSGSVFEISAPLMNEIHDLITTETQRLSRHIER